MTAAKVSVDAVLDRLALGPWRLTSLPTLRGAGLYFVALCPGDDPSFAWFSLDEGPSASRTCFFDRSGAAAFLREYERAGYDESMLDPWDVCAEPRPETLRAALARAQALLAALRAEPTTLVPAMGSGWLERSEDVGWVVTKSYERGPARFHCDDARAASELLSQILRDDHELEPAAPPAELGAAIEAERRRRREVFAIHGPAPDRLLLRSREGEPARGFMRFSDGVHAFAQLGADGGLERAELWPADDAFALIFRDDQGSLPCRSVELSADVQAQLASLRDIDEIERWHQDGAIRLRCGESDRGGFKTLDAETLVDDLREERLPVRAAIERFADGRGFLEVHLQEQVPPSVAARSEDDPSSANVRYLFPKVWLRRLARERIFELGFGAALRAASGRDQEVERTEENVERGEQRAAGQRVTLRLGTAQVVLDEVPIESGIGVHGSSVHASFHGLPPGLSMRGSGRIDMRGGGQLSLETNASEPELARRIKRAVLDALP